jgi:hypothetical protein
VALVLLAGCLSAGPEPASGAGPSAAGGEGGEAGVPAAPAVDPAANASSAGLLPAPVLRVRDAGASWSGCTLRSALFYHKHEAAAALVPPGYRQVNHVAGNIGANLLMALECGAVSVGNATVFPHASLALYGIRVDPPDAVEAPGANYLLLDLASSDPGLAAQLGEAFPVSYVAAVDLQGEDYSVTAQSAAPDGEGMDVRVQEALAQDAERDETAPLRLHWVAGDRACWADLQHLAQVTGDHDALLEATGGHPRTVAGGTGRMAGVGLRGLASGGLAPPACAEAGSA